MESIVTPVTAQRWAKALDRAISNALDVLVSTDGSAFVASASRPGLLYAVSRERCTCSAGEQGQICQHRAAYLAQVGELPLEPVSRVVFDGNSDRQEARLDGRVYGDAMATEHGGWELFRGRFPDARRIGTFCSLDELTRHLAAQVPEACPTLSLVTAMNLDCVAA